MEGKLKIVVLDDSEVYSGLLAAALEDDFEVLTGSNGLQGIALCLEGGVSAVITDISMPDFDGLSMIKEFAKNPALSSIPVLVVTATHFHRLKKEDFTRYPQVKRLLYKMGGLEHLTDEVKAVIAEAGLPPQLP